MANPSAFFSAGIKLYSLVLGVIGLALLVGGAKLLVLGGSSYYVLAGLALVGVSVAFWRAPWRGASAYFLFLLVTIIWAIWEAGLDAWALMPRLALFVALAVPPLFLAATGRLPPPAREVEE